MGNPMAGHLVRAGFDVTVFDIRPETMQAFIAQHGGKTAGSLAEAGRGADVVITMLPNDKIVRKAIMGESGEGAVAALARGAMVIDMSTSDPVGTRTLAEALKPYGVDVLDASTLSQDHAVSVEPLLTERIEVLRGPATLLYGGGAIGGVVNLIDKKVPTYVPANGYEGEVELRANSVANEGAGLLGLTVPPGFDPESPDEWRRYVYVLYTRDALPGGTAPKWGVVDGTFDSCPSPPQGPGQATDGCVVTGALSRLVTTESPWSEQLMLDGWCQQFWTHSIGSLAFGADEKLYVSGGDGAHAGDGDWGQRGGTVSIPGQPGTFYTPANPCGDPPSPIGTALTKPTAQGGALRSQSPRRAPGSPRARTRSTSRRSCASWWAASSSFTSSRALRCTTPMSSSWRPTSRSPSRSSPASSRRPRHRRRGGWSPWSPTSARSPRS